MAIIRGDRPPLPPRLLALFIGAGIGALWGAVMWGIGLMLGHDYTASTLLYLMITTAMIGGGVASVFGALNARKKGEKVMPKSPYRKQKDL